MFRIWWECKRKRCKNPSCGRHVWWARYILMISVFKFFLLFSDFHLDPGWIVEYIYLIPYWHNLLTQLSVSVTDWNNWLSGFFTQVQVLRFQFIIHLSKFGFSCSIFIPYINGKSYSYCYVWSSREKAREGPVDRIGVFWIKRKTRYLQQIVCHPILIPRRYVNLVWIFPTLYFTQPLKHKGISR